METILSLLSVKFIINDLGLLGITAIIFAESGLFFGFFLPGDSLLFSTGILTASGLFNLPTVLTILPIAAILGDSVGYWFGNLTGQALYDRSDSRFFKRAHLQKAHTFFERHGARAIILARFVPIVRTFVPIVAGAASMQYRKFLMFNIIGGLIWTVGLVLLGYKLGSSFPKIENYLLPITLLIILLSALPIVFEFLKDRKVAN